MNSFELQPTLRGKLLWLRPLAAEDWQTLSAVASDPLIWEQHPVPDRFREEVFAVFFGKRWSRAARSSSSMQRMTA
jgi:hypothetical protein